ncbi:hypothetical protein JAAARDRAFT_40031 [Jaapia argillacea MUCL 33604]|uniref:Uncharacterized protein n=1 Tax=Jaapia argillacea MUCL 33604 TaxID=933084 RepID=A0A067PCT8_9AGAM|nr:hypothetical protein JAAARDRAFT_40031 [Jaapia argillacea MUCL 33604]
MRFPVLGVSSSSPSSVSVFPQRDFSFPRLTGGMKLMIAPERQVIKAICTTRTSQVSCSDRLMHLQTERLVSVEFVAVNQESKYWGRAAWMGGVDGVH